MDLLKQMSNEMPRNAAGVPQLFVTKQEFTPGVGSSVFTQDLWFFNNAARFGAMVASDNRVLVGHLDVSTGIIW
jgi:hypothetical protein